MKKYLVISLLFALLAILLVACAPARRVSGSSSTEVNPPTPQAIVTQVSIREAKVESVEIRPRPAGANQVDAIVRGSLPDACTTFQDTQVSYQDSTFHIQVTVASPSNQGCIQIITPFEVTIPLETTNLAPGGYTVTANGVSTGFNYPFEPVQPPASLQLVVSTLGGNLSIAGVDVPLNVTARPTFNSFLPYGGGSSGNAYVLVPDQSKAVVTDGKAFHDLEFVQNPTPFGLAVWPGNGTTPARLAWATQNTGGDWSSTIKISAPDGTHFETLLTQDGLKPPSQLVVEFWSADGQWLYFSQEPFGLGGFIYFSGGSNLYKINITTKEVVGVLPTDSPEQPQACLDSISPDFQYIAEHCSPGMIRIRNLTTGGLAIFNPPAEIMDGRQFAGSARFSPDGKKLAYAVAEGNQENSKGWVVLSDTAFDNSHVILASQLTSYYLVVGWLDDQTLLIEKHNTLECKPYCESELWTIKTDGTETQKVADGSFLAMVPNEAIIQLPAEPAPTQGAVTAESIDIVHRQDSGKICTPDASYFVHATITTDGPATASYEIGSSAGQISAGYFDAYGEKTPYVTGTLTFEQAGDQVISFQFVGPFPYPDNISVMLRVNGGEWVSASVTCP